MSQNSSDSEKQKAKVVELALALQLSGIAYKLGVLKQVT